LNDFNGQAVAALFAVLNAKRESEIKRKKESGKVEENES
jgi:hypothetical protein